MLMKVFELGTRNNPLDFGAVCVCTSTGMLTWLQITNLFNSDQPLRSLHSLSAFQLSILTTTFVYTLWGKKCTFLFLQ